MFSLYKMFLIKIVITKESIITYEIIYKIYKNKLLKIKNRVYSNIYIYIYILYVNVKEKKKKGKWYNK